MPEEPIKQQLRRLREKTGELLDAESFNVGEARGKMALVCDFFCTDKLGYKIVKVCHEVISAADLSKLLSFGESCHEGTIIQIFFWHTGGQHPFYRPKLYYNQPKQVLPDDLKKLVK